LRRQNREPLLKPGRRLRAQLVLGAAPFARRKSRQDRLPLRRHEGAALYDHHRVVDRLGQIGEQSAHFGRALEAMLGCLAPARFLGDIGAAGNTEQRVMRLEHVGISEEHFVGRDQRNVMRISEIEKRRLDLLFDREPVPHQLHIEPVWKKAGKAQKGRFGRFLLAFMQQPSNQPVRTACKRDQSIGQTVERLPGELRLAARLALKESAADQFQQVRVSGFVLHQQHELIGRLPNRTQRDIAVLVRRSRHCELAADDRLYAGLARREREFQRAEQITAIGHRDRRHAMRNAELYQLLDADRTFGQRVSRMNAEMDEIGVRHRTIIHDSRGRRKARPRGRGPRRS